MTNCFQLIRKGEQEPMILQKVDDELWEHFEGKIPDPNDKWCADWYNVVGLLAAIGNSLEQIVDIVTSEDYSADLIAVAEYLAKNYTTNAWVERR